MMMIQMRHITPGGPLLGTLVAALALAAPAQAGSSADPGSSRLASHTVQDGPCKHTVQDCLPPFFGQDPGGGGGGALWKITADPARYAEEALASLSDPALLGALDEPRTLDMPDLQADPIGAYGAEPAAGSLDVARDPRVPGAEMAGLDRGHGMHEALPRVSQSVPTPGALPLLLLAALGAGGRRRRG